MVCLRYFREREHIQGCSEGRADVKSEEKVVGFVLSSEISKSSLLFGYIRDLLNLRERTQG